MKELCTKQDTIKFWYKFITEDCFAYVSLYTGTRHSNWHLGVAGIKEIAAILLPLTALHYQWLIPRHLYDLATLH